MQFLAYLFGTALVLATALSGVILPPASWQSPKTVYVAEVEKNNIPIQIEQNNNEPNEPKQVTLGFVGDIMLDRGVAASVVKNFGQDFGKLFKNLSFLKDFDIMFGSLEGPASNKGENRGNRWSFRMRPEALSALAEAGFDVLGVANNHIGDWGKIALEDTLKNLEKEKISYSGVSKNPTIIEKNGLKIGFLAFSDVGPKWLADKVLLVDDNFSTIVKNAAQAVDALIVSIHFGEEYKTKSNSRQQKLAKEAIDNGALILIGHHPHVIEETERYKNGFIAYSLGNFIFDQYFSTETMQGGLIEISLAKNPFTQKVEILKTKEKIVKLNKFFQPEEIVEVDQFTPTIESKELVAHRETDKKPACPKGNSDKDLTLFKINKENDLGDYIPKDLVLIDQKNCLRKEAAKNFKEMQKKAREAGLILNVTSGFRDSSLQETLFENWQSKNAAAAFLAVAPAKHSEHQLGTAVDLTTPVINNAGGSDFFAGTEEYKWLTQHAASFGFILSYPLGKEKLTGYKFEPWHWRYVGKENVNLFLP